MNLSALPELLLAWVKNQGAALLQSDRSNAQGAQFRIGAHYDGKVLDNLPGGRHLVQVAGQKLDMALPRGTQPGDAVRLTFLSGGPRPTFLLNQAGSGGAVSPSQPVSLSGTAQQVNALKQLVGPSSGRGVDAQAAVARPSSPVATPAGTPAAPSGTTPPLSGPNVALLSNAVRQAGNLAAAVSTKASAPSAASSVAQAPAAMASAARPIVANVVMLQAYSATVQSSPAGVVSPNTTLVGQTVEGLRASIPASTTLNPNVLAELPAQSRSLLPTRLYQTLSESGLFYEAHLARWAKGTMAFEAILREPQARLGREAMPNANIAELGGMPDEAARLAGRQIHLLEGAPFIWQGFAWPGQWLEWLVEERGQGEGGEGEEQPAQWVTELNLSLPRMGAIHIHLGLSGERIHLRLRAPEENTREEMRAALPILVKGLEAAGLQPVGLSVEALDGQA
jgi:hypothetical protein